MFNFFICAFIYFYFKDDEKDKDYYIKDGLKIPKNVKYFNVLTDNDYGKEFINSLNYQEQNEFVSIILKRFSGYHQYDYYESSELQKIQNNKNIMFTEKMVDFFGLEKVKHMKNQRLDFTFKWHEIVNDYRESSKGYTTDWSSLKLEFEEDILKNIKYIENLRLTHPEIFVKSKL